MAEITRALIARVGVDLAKNVIQVHAVDAAGRRVVTRAFKRDQFVAWCVQLPAGCLVAMEACSSAHLAEHRLAGWDVHLVSPYRRQICSGMLPGWMASHYPIESCAIALDTLAARAGVDFHETAGVGIDLFGRPARRLPMASFATSRRSRFRCPARAGPGQC